MIRKPQRTPGITRNTKLVKRRQDEVDEGSIDKRFGRNSRSRQIMQTIFPDDRTREVGFIVRPKCKIYEGVETEFCGTKRNPSDFEV